MIESGDKKFYIDERLKNSLDKVKKRVNTKDEDYFFAIDGEEGSGKSVFAMQLAKYLDPTFDISRVVFDPKQFQDAIIEAHKGQAIVFDEAFRGLSSRGALSEINRLLVGVMMECRQKNLFVIIVLPTIFLLDKYVALHRSKGLFHVYKKDGHRGYWQFYNKKKLKFLYLSGKQMYSYRGVKTNFRGRFTDNYAVDEDEYRQKKRDALSKTAKHASSTVLMFQRNLLLWMIAKDIGGYPEEKLAFRLKELGWEVTRQALNHDIRVAERDLIRRGVLMGDVK